MIGDDVSVIGNAISKCVRAGMRVPMGFQWMACVLRCVLSADMV